MSFVCVGGLFCVMWLLVLCLWGVVLCTVSVGCWAYCVIRVVMGDADVGHWVLRMSGIACCPYQRLMQQYAEIEKQIQRGR